MEAVALPTHPVGKCAEFEIKSSAGLLSHVLWSVVCVCAQLRGWVRVERRISTVVSNKCKAHTPEPTDQSIMFHKAVENISAVLGQRAVILLTHHGCHAHRTISDMEN